MLILLPLWLVVSTGIGLWMWYRAEISEAMVEPVKFTTPIDAGRLADDVRKLVEVVGARNAGSTKGGRGLTQVASMIEGALGVSNAGYRVELWPGPETPNGQWPIIVATLPGDQRAPLWLVAGYDTAGGAGVEANSTGVASLMAVAQALAGQDLGRAVSFGFLPHAYQAEGPVLRLLDEFTRKMGAAEMLLVVEAMGAGNKLMISSRDALALQHPAWTRHGEIVGAEAICLVDDFDLSSVLFELERPALRVATRRVVAADEADDILPKAEVHVISTRTLAELVGELAK